jgi:hypothetical protein
MELNSDKSTNSIVQRNYEDFIFQFCKSLSNFKHKVSDLEDSNLSVVEKLFTCTNFNTMCFEPWYLSFKNELFLTLKIFLHTKTSEFENKNQSNE